MMSSKKAEGSRKRGCDSCRKRHLRCDDALPCAQCSISGRYCVKSSATRFQHASIPNRSKRAQFDFDKDQPWLDTPKPVNFIEETSTLRLEYGHSEVTDSQSGFWVDSSIPYDETPLLGDEGEDRDIRPDEVSIDIRPGSASYQPPSAYPGAFSIAGNYGPNCPGTQGVPGSIDSRLPVPLDCEVSQQSMTFPVADKEIAIYLKRFYDDIAPTFFFGVEAGLNDSLISLGAVHRPLIDAILAAGGRGIPLDQSFRAASESSIEPLGASRQHTVAFERLLVQALWRFKARVVSNRPWPAMDIIPVQPEPLEPSLWFLLQQEIFISATKQEPLSLEMGDLLAQKHNPRLHWPCRLQLHLADVVNFCFGSGDNGHPIFDNLINFSLGWVRLGRYLHSASSFGPSEDGSVFPAVYAVGEGLLMEVQIYYIVRIMLSAHDPALPRLGKRRKDCMKTLDAQAKDDLMVVCGLAESLGGVTKSHIMACIAISLAGDRLFDCREQAAVMEILERTMAAALWNTAPIQQHLKEEWGWI